jgi:hypothetical protein
MAVEVALVDDSDIAVAAVQTFGTAWPIALLGFAVVQPKRHPLSSFSNLKLPYGRAE